MLKTGQLVLHADSKTVLKTGHADSKTVLKTGQLVLHGDSGTVRQC